MNVYNAYNLPPESYIDRAAPQSLIYLLTALRIKDDHMIIKDFNLYYPL
jgi:hypothetical protein